MKKHIFASISILLIAICLVFTFFYISKNKSSLVEKKPETKIENNNIEASNDFYTI